MKKMNLIRTSRTPGMLLCAAFCALALLTAGCNHDNDPNNERVAVQVSSNIDRQTRAHDDTWDAGDAIGIYMLNGTTTEASNAKYTTADGGKTGAFVPATLAETLYFPEDGFRKDFAAYYPYRNLANGTVYNVDVTTQDTQKDIDLMAATKVTGKDKNNPAVAFTFTHKLVKLILTIQPDGTSLTGDDLKGLVVGLTNQQPKATYDVVAGGAVNVGNDDAVDITLLTAPDGTGAEATVLPCATTEGMEFEFHLKNDANIYRWAVKDAPLSQQFAESRQYLYTITLGKTAVEVSSTVTDWMPGNGDGETGTAQ